MTKYRLLKKLPFAPSYEGGHIFELDEGEIQYRFQITKELMTTLTISPVEIFLLTNAGFLEELKEESDGLGWMPKEGEKAWRIWGDGSIVEIDWDNDDADLAHRSFLGVFPTKELAQAHAQQLIEYSRKLRLENK